MIFRLTAPVLAPVWFGPGGHECTVFLY